MKDGNVNVYNTAYCVHDKIAPIYQYRSDDDQRLASRDLALDLFPLSISLLRLRWHTDKFAIVR